MRYSTLQRFTALLVLSAFLPSIATSQSSTAFDWHGTTPWIAPPALGVFQRAVAGDFNNDGSNDVFVLTDDPVAEGKVSFIYSPASWDALTPNLGMSGADINDIAAVPAAGGHGHDLVFVDPVGLNSAAWNGAAFIPAAMSQPGSPWAGAVRVRAGDVDSNGYTDCVGITGDRRTVLVRRVDEEGAHTSSFTFPVNYTQFDLRILQWDGETGLEIALLNTFGVEVFTWGGTRIHRYPRPASTSAGDSIEVFRTAAYDKDRLVWARRRSVAEDPTEESQKIVELAWELGGQVYLDTYIVFPGTDRITAMAAADTVHAAGADGNHELLVQHEGHHNPVLLVGGIVDDVPESSFSPDFMLPAALPESEMDVAFADRPSQVAGSAGNPAPLFEDISGDGVPDVFLLVRPTVATPPNPLGWFHLWRGDPYASAGSGGGGTVTRLQIYDVAVPDPSDVPFDGTPHFDPNVQHPISEQPAVPGVTGEMYLTLNLPDHEDSEKLEIVVWSRDAGFPTAPHPYGYFNRFSYDLGGWDGTSNMQIMLPMNFVREGATEYYQGCQFDGDNYQEFWLGIRLADEEDLPPLNENEGEDTLRQVGEQYVVAFSASGAAALYIENFSDQRCVCFFPECTEGELHEDADCNCPDAGHLLSGATTGRRRFAPTENRLPPAPPPSWIDVL